MQFEDSADPEYFVIVTFQLKHQRSQNMKKEERKVAIY
jgi:hypothetical protein